MSSLYTGSWRPSASSRFRYFPWAALPLYARLGGVTRACAGFACCLGLAFGSIAQGSQGYLSRVGPPPLRLATSAPRSLPPPLAKSSGNVLSNLTATASASLTNATPSASVANLVATGGNEPSAHELIGPPPPPPTTADPKLAGSSPVDPTAPDTHRLGSPKIGPTAQAEGPPLEITAGGPAIGIRTLDNSARVGITPQMLVRFFSRKNNPTSPDAPNDAPSDSGTSTQTEAWVPVEFVPPQPAAPSSSSSATYQLLPKP